jgi:mono/diheme cytochrome c family protein
MARSQTTNEPRIHLIQDMDNQEKFKAQAANALFADGRAMRPPVPGAIARGDLRQDDHFYHGYKLGTELDPTTKLPLPIFFTNFPKQVTLDEQFILHGQKRYNIYCAPCHGQDGSGNGMVNIRALEIGGAWVAAGNLLDDDRRSRPVGKIFETISNGIRTMPRYGDQISETDRWAIVAYVKALQKAVSASIDDVPEKDRAELLKR